MNVKNKLLRLVWAALLLLLSAQFTMAQDEFYVKSLAADTRDLTALKSPRNDMNGNPCALLKIIVRDDIEDCDGANIGDIVTERMTKMVYLSTVRRSIKLNFKYHYPLEITFADYGIERLEGQVVYNVLLTTQRSEGVALQGGIQSSSTVAHTPSVAGSHQPNVVSSPQAQASNVAPNGLSLDGITNPVIANLVRNMVRVAGGTFLMGATVEQGSDASSDENPVHEVTLSGYYIGKYEVTQEEWQAVMDSNPSNDKASVKLPVERVSWNDCQEFIRRLNVLTGKTFRLPTEAEWEYAARGGVKSRGYKYSGSNDIGSVAWYCDNSGHNTHAVGYKQPNELGLYDMSGNVWEWCSDWFGLYPSSSQTNPSGASSGSVRVFRGGGWIYDAEGCRVSYRGSNAPSLRISFLGLRLAL